MILAALLLPLFAQGSDTSTPYLRTDLPSSEPGIPPTMISRTDMKAPVTKISPKKFGDPPLPWEFEWFVGGYGYPPNQPKDKQGYQMRVAVYSQEHKLEDDRAPMVARMLMRLWAFNYHHLRLDHSAQYNGGIVDVYLCFGGKPGGEQLFSVDYQFQKNPDLAHVNTIYFYDLKSFTKPIEMAREVAHEYGHATLPAVGGFQKPEDWANGYLGEKLFLAYLRDQMAGKNFKTDDTMGADLSSLNTWVKTNVDPLVNKVVLNGPNLVNIAKTGPVAMDAYLGLALYTARVLPDRVFARAIQLTGSLSAKDFPAAVLNAAHEPKEYAVTIPASLAGKAVWIPLSKGTVSGAKVLSKANGWTKIQPTAKSVVVHPKPLPVG